MKIEYKTKQDFIDGISVGETITTTLVKVGKHSEGVSYDGKTLGSISLNQNEFEAPDIHLTFINNELDLSSHGSGTKEEWINLLEDTVSYLKED